MKELKKCIEINVKIEADNLELNRVNTNIHEQNKRIKNTLKECKEQFKEYREVMNQTLVFNAENKNKAEHKTTVEAVELINLINSNSEKQYKIIGELLNENKKGSFDWGNAFKTAVIGLPLLLIFYMLMQNIILAFFMYVFVFFLVLYFEGREKKNV
jgi:hypothetical protein